MWDLGGPIATMKQAIISALSQIQSKEDSTHIHVPVDSQKD